jgi:N-acetylglucosaminyldiphosphoundecaprenol N-acetyl-beta-D-mannosaminyltransferase
MLNRSDLNHADGVGTVLALRLKGIRNIPRCNGSDTYPLLLRDAIAGKWRVFFLGGDEKTAVGILRSWVNAGGDAALAASRHGYAEVDDLEVIDAVAAHAPDLLLVGMGSPKQFEWIERHAHRFPQTVIMAVGGGIDFLAGTRSRGPRVLSSLGLEWLFRLARHPVRYFRRYVIGIPVFLFLVLRETLRGR